MESDTATAGHHFFSPSASRMDFRSHEERVLGSLRRILHAVDSYSKKVSIMSGVTAPQLVCLLQIADRGPMSSRELSRLVSLSPATLVGIIDRLENKGFIVRERCDRDRRVINLRATEAGQQLAAASPSPLQDSLADALVKLPDDERETIALALRKVADLMEFGLEETVPEQVTEAEIEAATEEPETEFSA